MALTLTLSSVFRSCSRLRKIGRSLPSSLRLLHFALALTVVLWLSCGYPRPSLSQSTTICFVLHVILPQTSHCLAITTNPLFYPSPIVPTVFLCDLPQVLWRSRGFSVSPLSRPLSTPVAITENRPQLVTRNSSTVVYLLSRFFPFFQL